MQRATSTRRPKIRPLILHAAVVLPMLALPTAAFAEDDKAYVGAECRPLNPATMPTGLDSGSGAMVNVQMGAQDQHQTWICPVVRDSMTKTPEFARITVQENGTGLLNQVNCTFEGRDAHGDNVETSNSGERGPASITPTGNLIVDISFASGPDNVLGDVHNEGYYFFKCDVPNQAGSQQAGVVSYKVSED